MPYPVLRFLKRSPAPRDQGFSLIELLVVLSILSILSILVTTGFKGIIGTAYTNEVADFANTLVRARAYAMANNTYVFVGIEEVDASQSTSGVQNPGKGRIGVTVIASNDGTRGYISSAPTALTPSQLTVVYPLRRFDNVHLNTSSGIANLPNSGTGSSCNLATASATSLTTFSWPLTGSPQYSFGNAGTTPGTVIQFSPQGEAQIVTDGNSASVLEWIEMDLVPTNGTTVSNADASAILIDGASGSVSTYRS